MRNIADIITDDNEMSSKTQKLLSIVFLSIASIMVFFEYTHINHYWFDAVLVIKPNIISTFIALFIIAPLYMRNILKWNKSIYTLISLVLFTLLFSSFIELALGGGGFKGGVVQYLIVAAVALSWLGMQAIAGVSWMLLIIAVAYSIIQNSLAMGFYGYIYITAGFIGLVLHSELNPGHLMKGLKEEFSMSDKQSNTIKNDINESADFVKSTVKGFTKGL